MMCPDNNPTPVEPRRPEELTGVYQPKRGPLAKTIAVLILVLLVGVPIVAALLTLGKSAERAAHPQTTTPSARSAIHEDP